jgi:hypothetical protein
LWCVDGLVLCAGGLVVCVDGLGLLRVVDLTAPQWRTAGQVRVWA